MSLQCDGGALVARQLQQEVLLTSRCRRSMQTCTEASGGNQLIRLEKPACSASAWYGSPSRWAPPAEDSTVLLGAAPLHPAAPPASTAWSLQLLQAWGRKSLVKSAAAGTSARGTGAPTSPCRSPSSVVYPSPCNRQPPAAHALPPSERHPGATNNTVTAERGACAAQGSSMYSVQQADHRPPGKLPAPATRRANLLLRPCRSGVQPALSHSIKHSRHSTVPARRTPASPATAPR